MLESVIGFREEEWSNGGSSSFGQKGSLRLGTPRPASAPTTRKALAGRLPIAGAEDVID